MDFIERLLKNINSIANLPIKCTLGYLGPGESFCLSAIAGGRVVGSYYNSDKDVQLNYEFMMKSKDQQKVNKTLWMVQTHLEELEVLQSANGSFNFEQMLITNKPYIQQVSDTGYYGFGITVQAKIMKFKGE